MQSNVESFNNKNLNYNKDINETNKNYVQVCYNAQQNSVCFVKNGDLTKKIGSKFNFE